MQSLIGPHPNELEITGYRWYKLQNLFRFNSTSSYSLPIPCGPVCTELMWVYLKSLAVAHEDIESAYDLPDGLPNILLVACLDTFHESTLELVRVETQKGLP